MTPLAGDAIDPFERSTVDHEAAADSRAEYDAEDRARVLRRAIDRLGDGEAVRIVRQLDGPAERCF
jgi:hypothetical protein